MANPNNITLRSEKGSLLSVEDLDLNMTELQNVITDYNTFVDTIYQNLQDDVVLLTDNYDAYVITTDNRLDIAETDISELQSDVTVSIDRLDNIESTTLSALQGFPVKDDGIWEDNGSYDINSVVTKDDISYISSVSNNTSTPGESGSWVSLTTFSLAEQVSYNDPSGYLSSSNVKDAIDELSDITVALSNTVDDKVNTTDFNNTVDTLDNQISSLNTTITTEITDVESLIASEISSLDSSLNTQINSVETSLTTQINNVDSSLSTQINSVEDDVIVLSEQTPGDPWVLSSDTADYTFDDQGRIETLVETIDGDTRTTTYTYDGDSLINLVTQFRGLIRTETFTYSTDGTIENSSAVITEA